MPGYWAKRAWTSSARRAYPVSHARVRGSKRIIAWVAHHYSAMEAIRTARVGINMAFRRGFRTLFPVDRGDRTPICSSPRCCRDQLANPPQFFLWKLSMTPLCFAFFSDMASITRDNSDPTVQKFGDLPSPRWRLWPGKRSVECCDCDRQKRAADSIGRCNI